ncbi:unnamed protein product [Lactuca saligna]|uniref:Uncharacterized protein n=1 Tax=Lactuca saligna TaxID=75948 RepID=A0AA36ENQ8_LACSI|nr:unnamed protein product [Lactuca saligna]
MQAKVKIIVECGDKVQIVGDDLLVTNPTWRNKLTREDNQSPPWMQYTTSNQQKKIFTSYWLTWLEKRIYIKKLYGYEEFSRQGDEYLTAMANRIATVFASMLEFPFVRYRAAMSLDTKTMTTFCDLIPTKLVATV